MVTVLLPQSDRNISIFLIQWIPLQCTITLRHALENVTVLEHVANLIYIYSRRLYKDWNSNISHVT